MANHRACRIWGLNHSSCIALMSLALLAVCSAETGQVDEKKKPKQHLLAHEVARQLLAERRIAKLKAHLEEAEVIAP